MKSYGSKVERTGQKSVEKYCSLYFIPFRKEEQRRISPKVYQTERLLEWNPNLGPAEPYLADAPVLYRSLVVNLLNKIVYWINDDVIEIVDFWDTRREPIAQAEQVQNK